MEKTKPLRSLKNKSVTTDDNNKAASLEAVFLWC